MLEEMQKIDTSVIDELMEVKKERETVASRLAKMTAEQTQVSDVVFRRVKRDYETRLSGLERKAAPLKDRGRGEFAKLKALLDRLDSQNQSTKFDKEELEFRHRLGEFEDKEFEKKLSELESKLDEQKGQLAEAGDLRGRFVDAFDSEQELTAPPPPATPAPAPPPAAPSMAAAEEGAGITAPQPVPPPLRVGATVGAGTPIPPPPVAPGAPPMAEPSIEGTVILPTEPPPGPAPKPAEAASAKLVAIDDDLGAREFPLQPQTFVGRTPDNHVRINKPTVSRRHAQVSQSDKGWMVKDLRSENGTYVNGEKVSERNLSDGDRVHFGTVRLIFRVG